MWFAQQRSSPTQYFWYRTTLNVSDDINSPDSMNWKIVFTLVIAWVLVYMCMIKGIASSGKVSNSFCVIFHAIENIRLKQDAKYCALILIM